MSVFETLISATGEVLKLTVVGVIGGGVGTIGTWIAIHAQKNNKGVPGYSSSANLTSHSSGLKSPTKKKAKQKSQAVNNRFKCSDCGMVRVKTEEVDIGEDDSWWSYKCENKNCDNEGMGYQTESELLDDLVGKP